MGYRELIEMVADICVEKFNENEHKPDPMLMPEWDIITEGNMERFERMEAFNIWQAEPSEENRRELLREIADEINYLMFLAGKVLGLQPPIR